MISHAEDKKLDLIIHGTERWIHLSCYEAIVRQYWALSPNRGCWFWVRKTSIFILGESKLHLSGQLLLLTHYTSTPWPIADTKVMRLVRVEGGPLPGRRKITTNTLYGQQDTKATCQGR